MKTILKIHPNWKKGNGEILGFTACLILLLFITVMIMTAINYSVATQQLTVACYAAGRAACVSNNMGLAEQRAVAVLKTIYGDSNVSKTTAPKVEATGYGIEVDGEWKIGNTMTITVKKRLDQISDLVPWSDMYVTRSLCMMIEDEAKPD